MTGWKSPGPTSSIGPSEVVLVEGSSFCISSAAGDITRGGVHGLFVQDTRVLSRWDLYVNDDRVRSLAGVAAEPYHGRFLSTASAAGLQRELIVERLRWIGSGMREQITVRNFGRESVECTIVIAFGADFADVFEVKDRRVRRRATHVATSGRRCTIETHWRGHQRAVVIEAEGATFQEKRATFAHVVPPHGTWTVTVGVKVQLDGDELPQLPLGAPIEESEPARRLLQWRLDVPVARTEDPALARVLRRSQEDLGSLRIADPEHRDRVVVAAGAPWFMALFGRDSLLTSLMALPIDHRLALGTLQTLARYQGSRINHLTEEEPGRILHELRFGLDSALALGGENAYYGTADATPLFVMLLGELHRWGLPQDDLAPLLPHADRALEWITEHGDRDGDGFIEYERTNDRGLANQGWKDSWDGVNNADGTLASPPIALCEVQAYVYAAYLARGHLARDAGQREDAHAWTARAERLKQLFNEQFWLPDHGYYAVALDGAKRPVDACASNMGHCLMAGIVDADKAGQVVEHLMSDRMFTGWGVRTLASDMGAYNPASYHNGSVWPHDNALIAAGLMRYGYVSEAQRVATSLIEAAEHFDGRLPELFCGFPREEYDEPIPYPTSCSPQAWAAAAPIHLLRILLRFDPCVPHRKVWMAPVLPRSFGALEIANVRLAGSSVSVDLDDDDFEVHGLPEGLELVPQPYRPSTRSP
ncbi:MAG: amylo-alpha,6-glucosidase [Pseudonocardiales bacterium]|nr:amylo-alpha,6-glucosidase [Pseudonocardiales bacterium]